MPLDRFQRDNQANWNDRAKVHVVSDDYGLERFVADPEFISDVIAFDGPRLGDLTGQTVAHLQCHIGSDSVSLARLGAEVIGLDFSDEAISAARSLSERANTPVRFEVGNVYDAAEVIGRTVDLVYTSVGVIYWLEDLDRWAAAVAGLLEPGGRFYLRDCHPQMWRHEEIDGALVLTQPHFHPDGSHYRWDESFTYTDGDHSAIEHTVHHEWFHTLPEIVNALAAAGLRIEHIEELEGLDWEFSSTMVKEGTQWFLPEPLRRHLPVSFVIRATR